MVNERNSDSIIPKKQYVVTITDTSPGDIFEGKIEDFPHIVEKSELHVRAWAHAKGYVAEIKEQ